MDVALVFPRYKYVSGDAPLGVSYIASNIRQKTDAKITVIDTTFHKDKEEIKKTILKNNFDIIGISTMTTMINDALRIAEFVKKRKPRAKVILGGPHPTVMPEETLSNKNVDAVCIGEGEEAFVDIIKNKGSFENIIGIWYKKRGKIIKNEARGPINDISALPFPAVDMLPLQKYFENWFQLDSVAFNLKGINIITSRGCPYQCTFCQPTLFKIFGNIIRRRSPENVADEIEMLKNKYNINAFMFQDDTLVVDRQWVYDLCNLLISRKLNLVWGCNARVNLVDEAMFRKMKEAGLRKVFIGIESGSQRILDEIYDKRITIKQIINATKILKKLDLRTQGYFMIGAPTETIKEINQTIKFAKRLDIDEATFSITTPLPKTYLYEKVKDKLTKDVGEFDYYKNPVMATGVKPSTLNYLKKKALLSFYLSLKHIGRTSKGFLTPLRIRKSLMKLKRF